MKKINFGKLSNKQLEKLLYRASFSQVVESICKKSTELLNDEWSCCGIQFGSLRDLHKHVSVYHSEDVKQKCQLIQQDFKKLVQKDYSDVNQNILKETFSTNCEVEFSCCCHIKKFTVLLFYHYVDISELILDDFKKWQESLCQSLHLKGKVRLASEGINGTIEGCNCAVELYKSKILDNKLFSQMCLEDFKCSPGDGNSFNELNVTICSELCTLGISSRELSSSEGGAYLTPEEFHDAMEKRQQQKENGEKNLPLLLDCRNFYESKIGHFDDALKPDLRKFSYFPEYVDRNLDMFEDRQVLTYCTGGIRCERATAYIKKVTNCSEVFQLKGGIHKYMEKYPNGYFKGKLFVFDNRYSIGESNSEMTSSCLFCPSPHNDYQLCSTPSCRQLVLICSDCRSDGNTTCCRVCAENASSKLSCKECECTRNRDRAPREKSVV